jgi:hypothetical protein
MDSHRFDALSKIVASLTTRRTALALLAGLGFGVIEAPDAHVRRKSGKCKSGCGECEKCKKGGCDRKNGKKVCKKGKCKPKPAGTPCTAFAGGACQNGTCINLLADEANCGALGNACGPRQVCQQGTCFPVSTICPPTTTTACTPSTPTGMFCGALCYCARSAEGNVVCVTSPAVCAGAATACTSSASCPPGQACIDVSTCCGAALPAPKVCASPCPTPA